MLRSLLSLGVLFLLGCPTSAPEPEHAMQAVGVAQMERDGEQPIDFLLIGDARVMTVAFLGDVTGVRLLVADPPNASILTIRFGGRRAGLCFRPQGGPQCCAQSGVHIDASPSPDEYIVSFEGTLRCQRNIRAPRRFALFMRLNGERRLPIYPLNSPE